jgi:hypothetical protein
LGDDVRVFDVVCTLKKSHYPPEDDPEEAVRLLRQKKDTLTQLKL